MTGGAATWREGRQGKGKGHGQDATWQGPAAVNGAQWWAQLRPSRNQLIMTGADEEPSRQLFLWTTPTDVTILFYELWRKGWEGIRPVAHAIAIVSPRGNLLLRIKYIYTYSRGVWDQPLTVAIQPLAKSERSDAVLITAESRFRWQQSLGSFLSLSISKERFGWQRQVEMCWTLIYLTRAQVHYFTLLIMDRLIY